MPLAFAASFPYIVPVLFVIFDIVDLRDRVAERPIYVMPGLDPGIHVFLAGI
jgi:hypothetical protein